MGEFHWNWGLDKYGNTGTVGSCIAILHSSSMSIKTHTFDNGFRLIWEKSYNRVPITTIYIYCNVGSIHDPPDIKGAAHFIEHMCFKGTKKIPLSKDIYGEYDDIGAVFNATTEKRLTSYNVRTQDKYTAHCTRILSDMLLNSVFKRSEFAKEEHVVIEENIRNSDHNTDVAVERLEKMLYKGSSYELPVDTLDYHKTPFDYKKVVTMYHQYYNPSNMILSIASNLSFESILKMVKQTDFIKSVNKHECPPIHALPRYTIPIQTQIQYDLFEKPNLNTTKIVISFRTCDMYNKDRYRLNILRRVISGTLSSRMTLLLREDNGLTYSSMCYTQYHEHSGEFTLFAELDKTKLIHNGKQKGVLPIIISMLNKICRNGVTASEVKRVHTNFQGSELFKTENNWFQANYNGNELLTKKPSTKFIAYNDIYDVLYKDICKTDIDRVIDIYLKKSNMNVCIVGSDLVSLAIIKKECEKIHD